MKLPPTWKAQCERRVGHLVAAVQRWPWRETLLTLRQRFREDRLGVTASSLTFTTLISLVPLMTVTLAVFTAFPMFGRFQRLLESWFFESLVPDAIAKPVLAALTQFAGQSSRLGAAGLTVLALSALAMMLTIDRALNGIWRVPRPRPIAQRVLIYWATATLGPLLLGASLSLTSYAVSASQGLVGERPGGVGAALNALQFVLSALAMAGLYRFAPNTHVMWQHALAGGVFAATGFEAAQRGLTLYLTAIPTYSVVYGAFATLPIFLVWLYCSWVVVLLGAVVAAYTPSLGMRAVRVADVPGWRFALAGLVLRQLHGARDDLRRGLSVQQLAETLRIDPLQIEPLVDRMVALDWLGRLDEAGAPRFVLLCDPGTTPLEPLIAQTLLAPAPELARFWQQLGLQRLRLDVLIGD